MQRPTKDHWAQLWIALLSVFSLVILFGIILLKDC